MRLRRAPIPDSPAGLILVCLQALGWVDKDTADAWMTYMLRFKQAEPQAMWATLIVKNANKASMITKVKSFTDWAIAHGYLFA